MRSAGIQQRKKLANVFDALGHYRRIAIVQALQKAGHGGLAFGELARRTSMSESNLKHHIRMMKRGGFLRTSTRGRFTIFVLDTKRLDQTLSSFLPGYSTA